MENVREKLDEAIVYVIDELKKMDPGCEAFSDAAEDLTTLHKLRTEEIHLDIERERIEAETKASELKAAAEEKAEEETKRSEERNRMLDRCVSIGTTVVGVCVPVIAGVGLTMKGYRFESTGVVGSPILKGLVQNVIHWFRPM